MLAGRQRRTRQGVVGLVGRGDDDEIDVLTRQQCLGVASTSSSGRSALTTSGREVESATSARPCVASISGAWKVRTAMP
ncbi:hypothetical protein ACU8V3_07345 [Cobetia marina]